ncbi:hypothetical protein COB52_02655 [Candidatus Kaiserbacteria bacterium]|nr:MAG: hypothetical protein COB52_02655 [Candidatus Kaiserbacteria bacterium]
MQEKEIKRDRIVNLGGRALLLLVLLGFAFYFGLTQLERNKISTLSTEQATMDVDDHDVAFWYKNQALNRSQGEGPYSTVGTVHSHIRECIFPESPDFSCLEAQWELGFKEYLGTKVHNCEIIEAELYRNLCVSGVSKDLAKLYESLDFGIVSYLQSTYGSNPAASGLQKEEYDKAFKILRNLSIKIKKCPSIIPANSTCLEEQWKEEFKKDIPEGKEKYCSLLPSGIYKRLCNSGAGERKTQVVSDFEK